MNSFDQQIQEYVNEMWRKLTEDLDHEWFGLGSFIYKYNYYVQGKANSEFNRLMNPNLENLE